MGGFIALGLVLCAPATRFHTWLPITSAVAVLAGGKVFLDGTLRMAKRRGWTHLGPSND